MHWQDFCSLLAKHNTRHNEKHLFQNEQSTKPHSIQKHPRELIFYCISLTLIMFGGLGSLPSKYSHNTSHKNVRSVCFIDAVRGVDHKWRTGGVQYSVLRRKQSIAKEMKREKTAIQVKFTTAPQETCLPLYCCFFFKPFSFLTFL